VTSPANNPFHVSRRGSGGHDVIGQEHHWQGHAIRVDYRARPATLWMLHEVIVAVDGSSLVAYDFRIGRCIDFTVMHNERRVPGQLIRRPDLLVWQVHYERRVDSTVIGTGRVQTGNRGLACAAMIAAFWFGFVPIPGGNSLLFEVLGVSSLVLSLICSLVAIRLMIGDLTAFRNPIKTDSESEPHGNSPAHR